MTQPPQGFQAMMREVMALAVPNVDDFAAEVGVSRATLYAWRNGKRNPTPENIEKLVEGLRSRGGRLLELANELAEELEGE